MNRCEALTAAAMDLAGKARKLPCVLEVAIVGSVAGEDPFPDDLDLAVVVSDMDESLAGCARQLSGRCSYWDVFLFDEDLRYVGDLCHRRECPGGSVECRGCGRTPHLRPGLGSEYDESVFFSSPIAVLWSRGESRLLARRDELGLKARAQPKWEDIVIECAVCGRPFLFTVGEQKRYRKMGLAQPKRCGECRERMHAEELGLDLDEGGEW